VDGVWALSREESDGDVMGFFHTHPAGARCGPSHRDIRTMRAWCSALGRPLLCLIAEEPEIRTPAAYVFCSDEDNGTPVQILEADGPLSFTVKEN
jgi:hypothetical protein